jgi:hypothetical protein
MDLNIRCGFQWIQVDHNGSSMDPNGSPYGQDGSKISLIDPMDLGGTLWILIELDQSGWFPKETDGDRWRLMELNGS